MKKPYQSLLVLSLIFCCEIAKANPGKFISIQQLVESGRLVADVQGLGGHTGACVEVRLKNLQSDSLHVWIEAGRKLDSDNPGDQDILVVKNTNVSLAPGSTQTIPVEGVCCQAKNSSPDKGSRFSIGKMAPALWVVLANFISAFNFDRHIIQQAVWVLSDEHDIRSIPVDEKATEPGLREKVAEILDIELPWYSFRYAEDSTTLFTGLRTHVFAHIPYEVPYSTIIHGVIYNSAGKIVYQSDYTHSRKGRNYYKLNVDIAGWELGNYKFELIEDLHTVNLYRTIELDLEEG